MLHRMSRRRYLATSLAASVFPSFAWALAKRPCRVLLRSSWQTVNIGDIGHTPGDLLAARASARCGDHALAQQHRQRGRGDAAPELPEPSNRAKGNAVNAAFGECDFLLHGSGASLVAQKDVGRWREATGKPYGIYGITLSNLDTEVANFQRCSIHLLPRHGFVEVRERKGPDVSRDGIRP